MSTAFIRPIAFTVPATSPAPLAGSSTSNMNTETPGQVWQGATTSYFIVDLGSAPSYDFISLVGTNLRSTDTVRVRTGNTNTGVGSYDSLNVAAWTGTKPDLASAIFVLPLPVLRGERYVRVDITATGHPSGYVQVQRFVAGKAARVVGVEFGAEFAWESRNNKTSGFSYESIEEGDAVPSIKFRTGLVNEADWRASWLPIMPYLGLERPILFILDTETPANWITDAIYGRVDKAGGKADTFNGYAIEAKVTSLSM